MPASISPALTIQLADAVAAAMPTAQALFDDLALNTRGTSGISRDPYGAGEQYAYRLVQACATRLELQCTWDAAGNLYMTRPGTDSQAPALIIGSHLDSVPNGGNYDGAAGVIAGLAVLEAFGSAGIEHRADVSVMAIRCEESSSWFAGEHGGHLGSRMALGLIDPSELDKAVRPDTGRSLGQHIADCGFDPDRVKRGPAHLTPGRIGRYFELHIEQGPVLEMKGLAVGVVDSIRGNSRLRNSRCIGAYNHGGATPQEIREDAVIATSDLVMRVHRKWEELHAQGKDLVFAFGKLSTDPEVHSLSKVPGETRFALDIRSGSPEVLGIMRAFVTEQAKLIEAEHRVRFELDEFTLSTPTVLDPTLVATLREGCEALDMPLYEMASGGGHDAQEFTRASIASAMVFVRNANGSHVAEEAMTMSDFERGTQLLAWAVAAEANR